MITLLIDGLIAAVKTIDRAFTAVENVVCTKCARATATSSTGSWRSSGRKDAVA